MDDTIRYKVLLMEFKGGRKNAPDATFHCRLYQEVSNAASHEEQTELAACPFIYLQPLLHGHQEHPFLHSKVLQRF